MEFVGRAWKFGDDINTDLICPGPLMQLPLDRIGEAAMAGIDPDFHKKISKGDIIVAGKNFGCGSSRELAPRALKSAGISVILAESFARIFFRNCISIGLPVLTCKGIAERVEEGDLLRINISTGIVEDLTKRERYVGTKYPKEFLEIIEAGGLVEWIKNHKDTAKNNRKPKNT